ncbi:hypothetical protein CYMTET_13473 [Cymbomonas tetramitiformis]|uniref:Glycosyl hydrolase family 30 TIM-barrel domain-containing protein n=1 Tax=Cymbomonas tetramitiformis TaxID=36881 RepID=A0AAE0GIB0_9CHLO|nr:hypothetical protein CYMTET_13473 [Cymbomonas tetramitiformis]
MDTKPAQEIHFVDPTDYLEEGEHVSLLVSDSYDNSMDDLADTGRKKRPVPGTVARDAALQKCAYEESAAGLELDEDEHLEAEVLDLAMTPQTNSSVRKMLSETRAKLDRTKRRNPEPASWWFSYGSTTAETAPSKENQYPAGRCSTYHLCCILTSAIVPLAISIWLMVLQIKADSAGDSEPMAGPKLDWFHTSFYQSELLTWRDPLSSVIRDPQPFGNGNFQLNIEDDAGLHEVDGVGATLTQSSAALLLDLKNRAPEGYWTLLHDFFSCVDDDDGEGYQACLRVLRLPISATEFIVGDSFWTYDQEPFDYALENVSLREDPYSLPVLQDILTVSPDLSIMAMATTAPTWLKTSYGQKDEWTGGALQDNTTHNVYATYARYLVKVAPSLCVPSPRC